MRYHIERPKHATKYYGETYICNHPLYDRCTLYKIGKKGLAVVQQRINGKKTYWTEIDEWLVDLIYLAKGFKLYFDKVAEPDTDGLYPTVTVRKLMWTLRMKPLPKERWETTFDRRLL